MKPHQTDDDRHPRAPNRDARRAEEHHQAQAQAFLSLRRSLFGERPYVISRGNNAVNADPEEEREANAKRTSAFAAKKSSFATFSSAAGLAFVASEQEPPQKIRRSKTPPIPLPECHVPRTSSELELTEEMMAAEYRERVMYHRLVSGMQQNAQKRQERTQMMWRGQQNQVAPMPQSARQGQAVSPQKHADVLSEALRIADESETAMETGMAAISAAGHRPQQPVHRFLEPQDCGDDNDADVEQRLQKKKLAEVLDRVANEDWSIEGFDYGGGGGGFGGYGYGSPRFGVLPQFPLLPPASGGCGMNGGRVIEPSPSVLPACWSHEDDGMVFNMDL